MEKEQHIKQFKECLSKLSIKELIERIIYFKNHISLRNSTEEDLKKELKKIFEIDFRGNKSYFFFNDDTLTPENHNYHFYRIRKFTKKDYEGFNNRNFDSLKQESDIWAKPSHLINEYGRLNRKEETILYASNQSVNAIHETNCQVGELFFLLVYKNKKRMRFSQIHHLKYQDDFTEEENSKLFIMHEFIASEFIKYVPIGKEYLYKTSLLIYELFFHKDLNDGFTYPSVKSNSTNGFNLAFNTKQYQENLNFLGAMVCRLQEGDETCEFRTELILDAFLNDQNNFDFYNFNSEISNKKFGNFDILRKSGMI